MRVKKIHWNAFSTCNLRCQFCYLWRPTERSILSTSLAKTLLEKSSGVTDSFVFGGGDPLLRKDILELVVYAKQINLRVDLQTNAVALTENLARNLFPRLDRLGLSMDGEDEKTHDELRGNPGNFNAILGFLEIAEKIGTKVTIRTIVTKKNLGKIKGILSLLKAFTCIEKWNVREFTPLGRGFIFKSFFEISRNEFKKEVTQIKDFAASSEISFPIVPITADDMKEGSSLFQVGNPKFNRPAMR